MTGHVREPPVTTATVLLLSLCLIPFIYYDFSNYSFTFILSAVALWYCEFFENELE